MNRTFSVWRMKAQVASVSSLPRSTRGWKVQSKPSSVLPGGSPLSLSEVRDAALVLALDLLLEHVVEEVHGAQVVAARLLEELGQALRGMHQLERPAALGDRRRDRPCGGRLIGVPPRAGRKRPAAGRRSRSGRSPRAHAARVAPPRPAICSRARRPSGVGRSTRSVEAPS